MTYSKFSPHQKEKNTSKSFITSSLGFIGIEASGGKIISVGRVAKKGKTSEILPADRKVLERARRELAEYFSGKRKSFDLPLSQNGTDFQRQVWRAMVRIPYGKTLSYGDIAKKLGRPQAARAVGQACNRNPHLIIVPCHRVVAAGGQLGGFALGLKAKSNLLEIEGHS